VTTPKAAPLSQATQIGCPHKSAYPDHLQCPYTSRIFPPKLLNFLQQVKILRHRPFCY
jgi:hypothetical protein